MERRLPHVPGVAGTNEHIYLVKNEEFARKCEELARRMGIEPIALLNGIANAGMIIYEFRQEGAVKIEVDINKEGMVFKGFKNGQHEDIANPDQSHNAV